MVIEMEYSKQWLGDSSASTTNNENVIASTDSARSSVLTKQEQWSIWLWHKRQLH